MGGPVGLPVFLCIAGYAEERPVHPWRGYAGLGVGSGSGLGPDFASVRKSMAVAEYSGRAKVLLSMVRLGIRIGSIPEKRYESVSEKLVEIGRMVGGLKKAGR